MTMALLCAPPVHALTLIEAVRHTVETHPSIDAATANRKASGFQLRQAQGRLLPTLDAQGDAGGQYIDQPQGLDPEDNAEWFFRRQGGLTLRQMVFDGFDRSNDIYKNAARLDAAALRVLERSEIEALNAIEAYIDLYRHMRLIRISKANVARHQEILGLVRQLVEGGKSPESDVTQTRERLAAARAVHAQVQQAFLEAEAKFRQVIGLEPHKLQPAHYPKGLPGSRQSAVSIAVGRNPTLKALDADIDVAEFEREQSKSQYWPQVSLEGSANWGEDLDGTPGKKEEYNGRVVLSWNLFNGFITTNRVRELNQRLGQAQFEYDARARDIIAAVERAHAAYVMGGQRLAAQREQVRDNTQLVVSYQEEYRLSKRSLLDLLDAERAKFDSQFQLFSIEAVHIFSAFQLLASMGILLSTLGIEPSPYATADHREQAQDGNIFNIDIQPLR
jgi:adhesin transport system outer membrane protein